MARTFLAVVGSFLLMNMLIFAALAVAWQLMGADRAFDGDSFQTSSAWVATMLGAGLVAAVIAGAVCTIAAGRDTAVMHLVIILLLVAVLSAVSGRPEPPAGADTRPANVTMMDAMQNARPPAWYPWAVVVTWPVGALIGGTLMAAKRREA